MVFSPSRATRTHDALGSAHRPPSVGDLLGAGASSEAGCSLVSVCEREPGMLRGVGEESEREGKGYASPCLVEIKGALAAAR